MDKEILEVIIAAVKRKYEQKFKQAKRKIRKNPLLQYREEDVFLEDENGSKNSRNKR